MKYKQINEVFNSKLIKDIFNDIDILKYHDKSVNSSSSDKLLDLNIVKNTNIKEDTIYKQLRGCLCNLYMQYIELLNKDNANDVYTKVDQSPLNIFSVITKLKKYGIDTEISNKENIVLPIIKNIQNYLKRLDKLINKLITGDFNNTIKDTALISLTNVYDEDIEEIPYTKLKRKFSEEIYNKIKNDNYFLVIRKPSQNIITGKITNTTNITNTPLNDDVVMYSYKNMEEDYPFNQAILQLQAEWNYCKDNLDYLNINGYEIPYYEQKYIKPVIEKIYYVFIQSNSLSSNVCYDVKSFQKKLKMYIGVGLDNPKIYLINTHVANIKKRQSSTETVYTSYNNSRHNNTHDEYQSIIKTELRDKLQYIIAKFKILNINTNEVSILVDMQKCIDSLKIAVYTTIRDHKTTNFSFLLNYSKFTKFLCNILYPYISELYNIMKQNTLPKYKLDTYINKLNTYNLYLSKYRKIIMDSL